MKHLIIKASLSLSLLMFTACHPEEEIQPSQNQVLNSISKSSAKTDKGSMQNTLDNWLAQEWTPTISQNKDIQKKYMKKVIDEKTGKEKLVEDKNRNFTLQEFVDKRVAYNKVHPTDENGSNVHKLEQMPVIGK